MDSFLEKYQQYLLSLRKYEISLDLQHISGKTGTLLCGEKKIHSVSCERITFNPWSGTASLNLISNDTLPVWYGLIKSQFDVLVSGAILNG